MKLKKILIKKIEKFFKITELICQTHDMGHAIETNTNKKNYNKL